MSAINELFLMPVGANEWMHAIVRLLRTRRFISRIAVMTVIFEDGPQSLPRSEKAFTWRAIKNTIAGYWRIRYGKNRHNQ
jgi:hypothetical protein